MPASEKLQCIAMIDSSPAQRCYLCGVRQANTKDHLFPKGLFPRPIPNNLPPRLPACRLCNEGLSNDEESFRVFVAAGMAYETQAGFRIWTERIVPDLQGSRPGLKPFLRSITKMVPFVSKTGAQLNLARMEMDRRPILNVLTKIAKGLYFLDTGEILPDDIDILADYFPEPKHLISPPLDEAIKGAARVDLGNGVVTYWRNRMMDDPTTSITWLVFCQYKAFLVRTFRQRNVIVD